MIDKKFETAGVAPKTYVLDNKISKSFIEVLQKQKATYQLVSPHIHWRNLAERAIETWNNNVKVELASLDPEFRYQNGTG